MLMGLVVGALLATACERAAVPDRSEAATVAASSGAAPARPGHPLDPLTPDEIRAAIAAARTDTRLASAAFPSITLHEPPKAVVQAWQRGRPPRVRPASRRWPLTASSN
jgi:Cu2+-containing amine oxidase